MIETAPRDIKNEERPRFRSPLFILNVDWT